MVHTLECPLLSGQGCICGRGRPYLHTFADHALILVILALLQKLLFELHHGVYSMASLDLGSIAGKLSALHPTGAADPVPQTLAAGCYHAQQLAGS